jgi:hypothetical protein
VRGSEYGTLLFVPLILIFSLEENGPNVALAVNTALMERHRIEARDVN